MGELTICAHAGVCARVRRTTRRKARGQTHTCTCTRYERMESIHRCGPSVVGSQTFGSAWAFNANIGAWNTAAVTMLSTVSAVPAVVRNSAGRALGRAINAHTSRLSCSYVTFYLAIVFYIFWCHRWVSSQYVLPRVYVRVVGEPRAAKHEQTHTCTCTRYERMETMHRCGPNMWSARRHSSRRRRSTRTSARGTPRPSRRCPPYVPFRPSCVTRRGWCARSGFNVHIHTSR
jgi:hypothetical protein